MRRDKRLFSWISLFFLIMSSLLYAHTVRALEPDCAAFKAAAPSHIQLIYKMNLTLDMQADLLSSLQILCAPDNTPENIILEAIGDALMGGPAQITGLERIDDNNQSVLTVSVRTAADDLAEQSLLLPVRVSVADTQNPIRMAEIVGVKIEGEVLQLRYVLEESSPLAQNGRLQVIWRRDGLAIDGASGGRYKLQSADVGRDISAEIQLIDVTGNIAFSVRSQPATQIAMAEYPPEAQDVRLSGEPVVGGELVAGYAFFDPNPDDEEAEPDIIWIRDNQVIIGATGPKLTLQDADIGKKITVRIVPRATDGQVGKPALRTLGTVIQPKPVVIAEALKPATASDPVETVVVVALPKPRPEKPIPSEVQKQTDAPTIEKPEAEAPKAEAPKVDKPKVDKPKLDKPKLDKPVLQKKQVPPPPPPIELTTGLTIAANTPKNLRNIAFTPTQILSEAQLDNVSDTFEGKPIALETIRDILEVMNAAYRDAGYELSRALLPEQHIDNGVLTIQLVDATIGQITFENRKAIDEDFLLEQLGLEPGDFIDLYALEVAIRRYNANNKSKITSELAAGSGFGETDIFIDVAEPDRIELPSVSVNNYSNSISDWQQNTFSTTFNNLVGIDDELTLTFADADGSISQGAVFSMPIANDGTNLTVSHNSSQTKSTAGSADTVGYRGSSEASGLSLSHPLIFTDDYSMYLSATYGQSEADLVQPVTGLKLSKSRTRRLSLGLPMSYSTGLTTISMSPVWSVINSETVIPQTNIWAQKGEIDLAVAQYINPYVTANLRSKMLYTDSQHMINMPAETLTVGGPSSVRAYQPSESSGYQGYFVSAELRTDLANWDNMTMPSFAPSIQPYIFVDHAMAQTQYRKRIRADYWSGAGIGVSIPSLFNFLTFDAYWAHPLDGDIHKEEKEAYEDELIQFSLSAKFRLQ